MPNPKHLAIALKRITAEQREKTGALDLRELEFGALPDPLSSLTHLESLDISASNVADLSPIAKLVQLRSLDCAATDVVDLTALTHLSRLESLDVSDTRVSDLTPLGELVTMRTLDCSRTEVADLSPLMNLAQLQSLDCSGTLVVDLTPLASLAQLTELNCFATQLVDLGALSRLKKLRSLGVGFTNIAGLAPLSELKQLTRLRFPGTTVSDLAPVANLGELRFLDCSGTKVSDLRSLARLTKLELLNCQSTAVTELTPLTHLGCLQWLNCSETNISDISPVAHLSELQCILCLETLIKDLTPLLNRIRTGWPVNRFSNTRGIAVAGCPLICPPAEFAEDSPEAVLEYFEQLGDDSSPLNEIKVIFLGEGASGKTSLIKRLRQESFNPNESQTHGIRIRKTPLGIPDGHIVSAHLWDFGGQEVMHATHQFFLSQRCIYVLVLDSRKDEKAEYWLKHAHSFGASSPVLIVLNKIDENPSFEVNRKALREKYPQIRDFFRVSCQRGDGLDEFRAALAKEVADAPARRTPFPARWLEVKKHFAHMREDYTDSTTYQAVCREKGVDRPFSQGVLLQFLHDLGIVVHFRKLKNFDTQILNPVWLTNGVYRIINSQRVAQNGGLLHEDDLDTVINGDLAPSSTNERVFHYPRVKLGYIVRVMEEFELCYPLDKHRFIVPQLLPVQEPNFEPKGATLRFEIRFPEFLPDSIFPRLMAKLHAFVKGDLRWRSGMVLEKSTIFDATARVRVDKEDQALRIDVCGQEPRRLLSYLRATVKEIVADFAQLSIEERVPIPNCQETWDYSHLVAAESAGEKQIFVPALKRRVDISELLNGVEEAEMRDELAQTPVRAFVSYSHKDAEHLQAMRAALSPLVRLNKLVVWDDRAIDAGNDWNETIFRELGEADIVLCLVSADFIHSDFCYSKELKVALDAHARREKFVVPIRIRECAWDELPLAKFQGVPGTWISAARDKDAAWTEVATKLKPTVAAAKARNAEVRARGELGVAQVSGRTRRSA